MPRLKTIFISQHQDTTKGKREGLKVVVSVSAAGTFYCDLPAGLYLPLLNVFAKSQVVDSKKGVMIRVFSDTLEPLQEGIQKAYREYTKPTIKKEPVICFNIESHVSFAVDENQNIFPNSGYPGATWPDEISAEMYGGHTATQPARGGYSLIVGAKAMLKITHSYGGQDKVTYENYYMEGSHLGHENPAQRLNSWVSFNLGENFREIPYSDEAAEFFFNLMQGMARLAQMIQSHTFEQESLLNLIFTGKNLLPGGKS